VTLLARRGAAAQLVEKVQQKREVRGRLVAVRIVRDERREALEQLYGKGRVFQMKPGRVLVGFRDCQEFRFAKR
jgi:hypothetical protein